MEIKVAAGDYAGAALLQTELKALKATPKKQQFRQPEMSQDRRASKLVFVPELLRTDLPMPTLVNLEAVHVMCAGKLSTVAGKGKGKGKSKDKGEDNGKGKGNEKGEVQAGTPRAVVGTQASKRDLVHVVGSPAECGIISRSFRTSPVPSRVGEWSCL